MTVEAALLAVEAANMPVEAMDHLEHSTKDLINFIPIYCHHWDCGLGQVLVRQAWGYLRGCEMS